MANKGDEKALVSMLERLKVAKESGFFMPREIQLYERKINEALQKLVKK